MTKARDISKLSAVEVNATGDQTDAEVKAAVEAASDSNTFTDADHSKLNAIEASADVTDTANVTSSGALMDSELTNLAAVKAINQSLVTTADAAFASLDISGNIDVDGISNLDVVDIDGAVDMASTLAVTGVVTANAGVVVDNFTLDGTTLALSSGDMTLDVAGNITLDADDAGEIRLKDGGTQYGALKIDSSRFKIQSIISDADMLFAGNDGGSEITALTLDMSDAGTAIFNNKVGIATNAPLDLLHLQGGGANDSVGAPIIRLQKTSGGAVNDGQTIGGISWFVNDSGVQSGASYERAKIIAESQNTSSGTRLEFWTGNSNADIAEAMRIIADGNVGIGETSPARKLHVNSGATNVAAKFESTDGTAAIELKDNAGTAEVAAVGNSLAFMPAGTERARINSDGKLLIGNSTSQTTDLLQVESPASGGGHGIAIRRNDNNTDQQLGRIMFGNTADSDIGQIHVKTTGATNTGAMIFSTASSGTTAERMRIASNGRQTYNGSSTANGHANFVGEVGSSSKAIMFEHTVGGGECGKIITTSNSAVLSNTSDYRLKENVNYTWDATTRLKQLKPARFNWINDETNTLVDGFIAHEVSSIVPTAVYGEKDGVDEHGNPDWQGIAVTELVPLLVKTIQELEARITALEA